jgi:hypothetical protein
LRTNLTGNFSNFYKFSKPNSGEAEQNQGQDFSELMCLLGSSTKLTL